MSKAWDKKNRWYAKNYQKRLLAFNNSVIVALKDVPCADCGKIYPSYVMEFDHRDPSTKLFDIGHRHNATLEKIFDEVEKCDVVCSNCHRIRHHHGYGLD